MIVDTVVFELDGTLADTVGDITAAINAALRHWQLPELTLAEVRSQIGLGGTALIRAALAKQGRALSHTQLIELQHDYLAAYAASPDRTTRLYPGAAALLTKLRNTGIRLALCTNKPSTLTHRVLTATELRGCFDAIISGDSLPSRKPDPTPVLYACARAGGEHAMMVGDTASDVAAGRKAGLPVVCVDYGYHPGDVHELQPDVVLSRLSELVSATRQAGISLRRTLPSARVTAT